MAAPAAAVREASTSPRLLLACRDQFGYLIDAYYFSKYLARTFDVHHVCWDYDSPRVAADGVEVRYVSRAGNKLLRYARFLAAAARELRAPADVALLFYFPGCSLIRPLIRARRVVLDVRTGSVHPSRWRRALEDGLLHLEARVFRDRTVLDAAVGRRLGLGRFHRVPLGAPLWPVAPKRLERLDLLYVGTLDGRRLVDTVAGLARFRRQHGDALVTGYDIVGGGSETERRRLQDCVREHGLESVVRLHGYVPHTSLRPFFERCNVGIAYVPRTEYYDDQPPTKTFEYLLAGMPVVATSTRAHAAIVGTADGVLVTDDPEDFGRGLAELWNRRASYDSSAIRERARPYEWKTIVDDNLRPYLES